MKPIRILLADDHKLMRAGIRSLLDESPGLEVIGEAGNGKQALDLVATLEPDIVLMDMMMPEMSGLDATAAVVARFPKVRVIILTMNADQDHVLQALRAGAAGYLLKNIGPEELETAILAVAQGEKYITSAVTKHVLAGLVDGVNPLERLTPRQRQVLQLVAESKTSKQIAKNLGICLKTAEAHRGELMKSLGIHDIAGLVRYAIRIGLISANE